MTVVGLQGEGETKVSSFGQIKPKEVELPAISENREALSGMEFRETRG